MDIAIIGAGASGILAALESARKRGHRVVLFEKNPSIGRKLLVTGSGRCNVSNDGVKPQAYTCADEVWMAKLLSNFRVTELRTLFTQLGLPLQKTDDGWYYPLSESAHSLVEILQENLLARRVELRVATTVTAIHQQDGVGGFDLTSDNVDGITTEHFDALMVACGGSAYPTLGSDGNFFTHLAALGHTVQPLLPALGPIYVQLGGFKALQGLRFDASTCVLRGGEVLGESSGNVIITEKGFNGPGVMNLSHLVSTHPQEPLELTLNLAKPVQAAFEEGLATSMLSVRAFLLGFFPPKIVDAFLEMGELKADLRVEDLTLHQWERLVRLLSNQTFEVTGCGNAMVSQVSVGGVPVTEVDADTLESKLVPGLYLVGETLDAVGPCGGFNLHFAFATGAKAGWALAGL
ncbi:MAG TPA: aminoacetone oxidase family FAD-binding enzyme [Anaerolineaceae bacterium]|nr:aminoacetone oxidase family FAD-binding enzyme [Anaerolineaceae bacterium]